MAVRLADSVQLAPSTQQRGNGWLSCFMGRLENHADADAEHLPRLFDDTVKNLRRGGISIKCDMAPWWDRYRAPLASIGITLNELDGYVWVLPATTPPSSLPYAIRCTHEQPALDKIKLLVCRCVGF
ncbi:hypothetical protein FKP32DRAFT_172869 [Trametes sanguinea]|nr:hypothetical protein FKP32DRAFT_172869 [Trametes sanguinea]